MVVFALMPFVTTGQICPPNLDVEFGNFTNWQCYTGTVAAVGNTNAISVNASGPAQGQHLVYTNKTNALDAYGQFPQTCPNGSGYSIHLGNNTGGRFAESISYSFTIPANADQYSLLYWYAVVFQNPDHQEYQQPRFVATVHDETASAPITCASFTYVGSSGLPGFQQSLVNREVVFKTWTPVTVNLNGLAGHRIRLEFTTADCTQGGHFGYAYIDVNSQCSQPVKGATYCQGANSVTLNAPFGFQGYNWLNTAGQTLGASQTLNLSPPPSDDTVLSVALQPYPGFGCVDTLRTVIRQITMPTANAGPDTAVCEGNTVQIGSYNNPVWQYQWSPAAGLSNPTGAITLANPATTTLYQLAVTDSTGGCTASDSVLITPLILNATLSITGDTLVCEPQTVQVLLQLSSTAAVQWYKNGVAIAGATSPAYNATTNGVYYAVLRKAGCTAQTRSATLLRQPKPSASFSLVNTSPCLPSNNVSVQTASSGASNWTWGEGSGSSGASAGHKYSVAGTYIVRHILVSAAGCADTSTQSVTILPVPQAAFSVMGGCVGLPVKFINSTTFNSPSTVNYQWAFPSGDTVHTSQSRYVFAQAGTYTVRLLAFSADCPNDVSQVNKTVTIMPLPSGRSKTINAVMNQPVTLSTATQGTDHVWMPEKFLSSNLVAQPQFTGTQAMQYRVAMVNAAGCPFTDTVEVRLFKEGNLWVPSAFTPNGDGKNDQLRPVLAGMERLITFSVWNRWGQMVFQTSVEGHGWDGTVGGKLQATDNFVWIAEAIATGGKKVFRKGSAILIR